MPVIETPSLSNIDLMIPEVLSERRTIHEFITEDDLENALGRLNEVKIPNSRIEIIWDLVQLGVGAQGVLPAQVDRLKKEIAKAKEVNDPMDTVHYSILMIKAGGTPQIVDSDIRRAWEIGEYSFSEETIIMDEIIERKLLGFPKEFDGSVVAEMIEQNILEKHASQYHLFAKAKLAGYIGKIPRLAVDQCIADLDVARNFKDLSTFLSICLDLRTLLADEVSVETGRYLFVEKEKFDEDEKFEQIPELRLF